MLELYQTYQTTDNQELLINLLNHHYVLKIISYQIQSLNTNQIELEEVQNVLFERLVRRKDKCKFEHEYQFKSYLSITIKGIILDALEKIQKKGKMPLNQQENDITYDDYTIDPIPKKVLEFINAQGPEFMEYVLGGKSLSELSKKYHKSPSALSVRFKPLKQELRDYYVSHALN